MNEYIKNGKTVKCKVMPQGYYEAREPDFIPVMMDENYEGFRIVYVKESIKARSAPNVINDTMQHTLNPVDGKMYDSKAKYYRKVREAGCEIVGNDSSISKPRADRELSVAERKRDIARALEG
jgi:hypothetical protein